MRRRRAVDRLAAGRDGTVAGQQREGLAFGGPVAADEQPSSGIGCTAGRIVGRNQHAGVVEPDLAGQMHARLRPSPLSGRRISRDGRSVVEHELGLRDTRFDLPAGPCRQHEAGHVGEKRESLDQAVDLSRGHLDRPASLKLFEPAR